MNERDPSTSELDSVFWDEFIQHVGKLGILGASITREEALLIRQKADQREALDALFRSLLSFVPARKNSPDAKAAMEFFFRSGGMNSNPVGSTARENETS